MSRARIKGLYAITPDMEDTTRLHALVESALRGGASLVQYRNKAANAELRIEQAAGLLALCHEHGVPLIINDHIELCRQIDADGVHLGLDDHQANSLADMKATLGSKILGVSCYNRFELAQQAAEAGVEYVAFGSCFDSGTKPAAVRASLDLFTRARAELGIPAVAIGGITLTNAPNAIAAGADAIAVIGALFSASDVTSIARQFSELFDE